MALPSLLLRPVLLAAACLWVSVSVISNAGVAEAAWWWSRWDSLFPSHVHPNGNGNYGYHGGDDDCKTRVASIVTEKLYGDMFKHKDDAACPAHGFYNYTSFIRAAERFPEFGGDGDAATRKREVAAFLAQISHETTGGWAAHETTGGWATAPDGPYAWGLCFNPKSCKSSCLFPCTK